MPLAVCCAIVASVVFAQAASAQEPESSTSATRWRAELGVGAEYDTNVTVDEVDLSSGQSDYARILDFELGVKHNFSEKTAASLNYDISQSSYNEFSRVDRLTQILGADINTDLGGSNAGVSAYYIDSQLDGEPFLRFVRASPYVSGFMSRRWFARGAYVYSEREIDQRPQRDAQTQNGEIDVYFFQRGLRSYFNLGYRYRDEDAVADELDFRAHSIKLRYIRRFALWQQQAKAEFAVRYEIRDYPSDEPTIGEPRQDDRIRWKLDLEMPLSKRVAWQWYYSYGDYVSNLPRADFTQTIVGTRLQFRW
jgi:hypothetical protein